MKRIVRRVLAVLAGVGLGAVGGFVGSLLRRRPTTRYADSLRQPVPSDDSEAAIDQGGR